MVGFVLRAAPLLVVPLLVACGSTDPKVTFLQSTASLSWSDRALIKNLAIASVRDARALIPSLPGEIELTVRVGSDVIVETGETATALPPRAIMWTVDAGHKEGTRGVASKWLRASLLHELHHLARHNAVPPRTIRDYAVYEGMATAFERDYGRVRPPWGDYSEDPITAWVDELTRLPDDADIRHWIYLHPDGRRWIGLKVGTYWVDRAVAASSQSSAAMVATPTDEVIRLAR